MYLDSLLLFHALCDWIDILKSPEWVYGRGKDLLEIFAKHGTEKLAAHAVFGMFQTFQQILTYGEGWENLYELLPLASALDLNNQSAMYLQFLWHQIQQLLLIYGGVATTSVGERIRHHENTRATIYHYAVCRSADFGGGQFRVAASYGNASFGFYELVESLVIVCLGLFPTPTLIKLSSRIRLPIIDSSREVSFGFGLNVNSSATGPNAVFSTPELWNDQDRIRYWHKMFAFISTGRMVSIYNNDESYIIRFNAGKDLLLDRDRLKKHGHAAVKISTKCLLYVSLSDDEHEHAWFKVPSDDKSLQMFDLLLVLPDNTQFWREAYTQVVYKLRVPSHLPMEKEGNEKKILKTQQLKGVT